MANDPCAVAQGIWKDVPTNVERLTLRSGRFHAPRQEMSSLAAYAAFNAFVTFTLICFALAPGRFGILIARMP